VGEMILKRPADGTADINIFKRDSVINQDFFVISIDDAN